MGKVDDARRVAACHYEAGRAMACWWGGVGATSVVLATTPPFARLAETDAANPLDRFLNGETYDVPRAADILRTPAWRAWGRMEIAMVTCYAGSVAWARHRRRRIATCLTGYGKSDAEMAEAISRAHCARGGLIDRSASYSRESALIYATKLVRSRQAWQAVSAIAETLREHGLVSAEEIDAQCYDAFDARPLPMGWDPHWPPGYDDLEGGQMPQAHWPWYHRDDFYDKDGIWVPPLPNPYREHLPLR